MLNQITPVILTFNEAPNIGRTLERLSWAQDVVVVDSLSTDETLAIVSRYSNARVVQCEYISHSQKWNFAVKETGIHTEWVLALDADYIVPEDLMREIQSLTPAADVAGYRASFKYCIEGRPLRATVYTPVIVLFRRDCAHYTQDGHTQRVKLDGMIEPLMNVIYHDDRKALSSWVEAQNRCMRLDAEKLLNLEWKALRWPERIRRLRIIAPFAMLFYCLFVKGLILDGRAGIFYSFQRAFAELLLSLYLLEKTIIGMQDGKK